MPRSRPLRPQLLIVAVALVALVLGWRALFFLTDDAYIAFRYVRNLRDGLGLVWNPAPFPPVEGYTSLLWVLLLAAAWALGAPPPVAASALALLCGVATLLLAAKMLWRMNLPAALDPHRALLLALVLGGMVSNRTFLTWLSSGLETALFNLLVLCWIAAATRSDRRPLHIAAAAALLALTRPDGLLYVAASLPLLARTPAAAAPLLAVPAHLLWRKWTYGLWLPNTYYAKVNEPWPEAGLRYLACFIAENGAWVWIVLAAAAVPALARAPRRHLIAAGALAAHVSYYVLRVGGDHFEYRVLSHLIAPMMLSAVWLLARTGRSAAQAVVALVLLAVAGWPLAWVHYDESRRVEQLPDPEHAAVPIAHRFPPPLQSAVAVFDDSQAWLSERYVCKRRHEHALFLQTIQGMLPTEEEGAVLDWQRDRVLYWSRSVGYPGWSMPGVAVIDALGLNDPVVAAGPTRASQGKPRRMAHEREPPQGFLDCFRFNLTSQGRRLLPDPAVEAMTDEEIDACYARFPSVGGKN